ncbi:MAG: NAD(P)H-dependent glycerol-3-phosphate dehydrogenase [Ignavibacteria bacterium]|nr:NAD(P)H-dependent glycerol-3-phosphate dehydrogenase [Ignavibacteria bacterium]MCU7502754.1 NAD(P)H-dependent glycerol-3-phosphate dehydrogenase [Ignavibacteria bacterium]MCU7517317.1 NAD(P)H-dependent glycerol-3-phosphate dehydrogenase [Ignavibacteria bacterium]
MNISVLGAGGWGTTLAILLHYNGHKVSLWEYDRQYAKSLDKTRENKLYLPGIKIPEELIITHDLDDALENNHMTVLAVPSQFLRSVIKKVDYAQIKNSILVSVAKGIENKSLLTMSQMLKDQLPSLSDEQIGVLSGPSHAEEVSRRIPTAVVAASKSEATSKSIQSAFIVSYFRVYSSTDILGVELGGAVKNVIAIGAGIIDGAKFGDNTKAAIMTRGIAEISRLGTAMGSRAETFAGLSGMGDLIVTCMSKHSRNRFVGEKIGEGKTLKQVLKSMTMVAEGVETCRSVKMLAEEHKVCTPIVNEVYSVLFEEKDPVRATTDLMTRDMRSE